MWGRGAAALIAFAVLGSQPAIAGVRIDSEVSGALTVTWHGDPARGCADAGVCDVTGSVTVRADEGSSSGSSDTEHVLNLLDVQTQGGIVRVSRGTSATCLDGTGEVRLTPRVLRRAGPRAVLALGAEDFAFGGQLGAGRCTGPLPSDVAAAMPRATVPERVLRRAGAFDLRFGGRRTFAAGPFAGSVSSTLEIRGRAARTRGRIGPFVREPTPARPRHRRVVREEGIVIGYRVAAADGALTTAFQGGPSPDCDALDACGMTGTHELRATPGATVNFFGTYPLGRGRALTVDQLLAKARAGALRLTAFSGPGIWHGQASVSVTRPDGSGCRDARPVTLPGLEAEPRAADFFVALGGPTAVNAEDPLATRCPGPRRAGRQPAPLATGTLPVSQAGAPRLTLRLSASGGELGAMPSSRGGELTLDLVRTRADVHTRKEPG